MNAITFTQAKAHLSELIERAAAGETVEITKRGKPMAKLGPPERKMRKIDVEALEALRARLPYQEQSAGDFIREMRDDARY